MKERMRTKKRRLSGDLFICYFSPVNNYTKGFATHKNNFSVLRKVDFKTSNCSEIQALLILQRTIAARTSSFVFF